MKNPSSSSLQKKRKKEEYLGGLKLGVKTREKQKGDRGGGRYITKRDWEDKETSLRNCHTTLPSLSF